MMALLSKAVSAISALKLNPSISGDADSVELVAGQQDKAYEIPEGVGEREDLGRQTAFGSADGLALKAPFAPWPWRWTLTMVASTMAYSRSGSSEQASEKAA